MSEPIKFREFDVERIKRELEESLPATLAQIEALREAKKVSRRVLDYVIDI